MSISASPGWLSCGSSLLAGGPLCIILGALCFSTTGTVQALAPDGSHPLGNLYSLFFCKDTLL